MVMFVLVVVIQIAVVGVVESRGKMNATPVALVITNQIKTSNGEVHRTVFEMAALVLAEVVVLAGMNHLKSHYH